MGSLNCTHTPVFQTKSLFGGQDTHVIDEIANLHFIQKCNDLLSNLDMQAFIQSFIVCDHPRLRLIFPPELLDCILLFIGSFKFCAIEILRFSASGSPYMAGVRSQHQLLIRQFHDNNQCARIVEHYFVDRKKASSLNSEGILRVSTQHVFEGRHCWRISVSNPQKGEIFYGVTHPSLIESVDVMKNCIGASDRRQLNHGEVKQSSHLAELLSMKCCVDMLLDASCKTLQICRVQNKSKHGKGIVISSIRSIAPSLQQIPHENDVVPYSPFIYHCDAKGASFRIAKIPASSFGLQMPLWITK